MLRTLLFCGVCGEIYGCRVKHSKNEYYYYCRSKENNWRKIDESKKVSCDVKKSLNIKNTDEIVWNTLLGILQNSHILKEKIKTEVLSIKPNDELNRNEKSVEYRKKSNYVQRKIEELEKREKDNREWYLIGEIGKEEYENYSNKIQSTKQERFRELDELNLQIQNIKNTKKWIDWLEKHKSWISDLRKTFTYSERKDIINTHVERIEVYFDKKMNQHKLILKLKLPLVNDKYVMTSKGGDGKSREYKIQNGKSSIETTVGETKKGRKKKVHNLHKVKDI